MELIKSSQKKLDKAAGILKKGGVVIFPTDTVYGFLADATNEKAVSKIFSIKNRPKTKPLPVFIKDIDMAKEIAEINEGQEKILKKNWPGKFTFILGFKKNAKYKISKLAVGEGTIALRMPKYRLLNDLLNKIDFPLAQTSVNLSGMPPMVKIKEIIGTFENQKIKPDLIFNAGDLSRGKPSQIVELISGQGQILR